MIDGNNTQPRIVPRNVSLYPQDWAIVQQAAQDSGQRTISAGLRAIIAEYVQMKATLAQQSHLASLAQARAAGVITDLEFQNRQVILAARVQARIE